MVPGTDPAAYRAADLRARGGCRGAGDRSRGLPGRRPQGAWWLPWCRDRSGWQRSRPGSGGSGYEGAERAGWSSSAVWNSMRSTRTPATDSTSRRAENRMNCQEANDRRWAITKVRVGSVPGVRDGPGSGGRSRYWWWGSGSGGRSRYWWWGSGSGGRSRYWWWGSVPAPVPVPVLVVAPGPGLEPAPVVGAGGGGPVLARGRGLGPIGSAPGAGPRTVRGGERPSTGCDGPFGGSTSTAEPCWRSWSDPLARRA